MICFKYTVTNTSYLQNMCSGVVMLVCVMLVNDVTVARRKKKLVKEPNQCLVDEVV